MPLRRPTIRVVRSLSENVVAEVAARPFSQQKSSGLANDRVKGKINTLGRGLIPSPSCPFFVPKHRTARQPCPNTLGVLEMKEYFVSYRVREWVDFDKNLPEGVFAYNDIDDAEEATIHVKTIWRCSIGELSEVEFEYFKSKAGHLLRNDSKSSDSLFVCSIDDIQLDSLCEKERHDLHLKMFKKSDRTAEKSCLLKPMFELQDIAEKVRALRKYGDSATAYPDWDDEQDDILERYTTIGGCTVTEKDRSGIRIKSMNVTDTSVQPNTDSTDAIDIADLTDETKWRLVTQADYLNHDINTAPDRPFSSRELEESRQNGNTKWLDESQGIGQDAKGRYLKRTGKNPHNYRYQYFLPREFDTEYVK